MRLFIGIALILAAIPYAMYAFVQGVREPYMGIVAFVVAGGIMIARAVKRRVPAPPRGPLAVPPSWGPSIPAAPRLPSIPPTPPDDETKAAPPPPTGPHRERETILPPKKAEHVIAERGHLKLVHSDGRPCDVRAPGRKKAAK